MDTALNVWRHLFRLLLSERKLALYDAVEIDYPVSIVSLFWWYIIPFYAELIN